MGTAFSFAIVLVVPPACISQAIAAEDFKLCQQLQGQMDALMRRRVSWGQ